MFLNPTYIMFSLPAFLLALLAQWWVKAAYKKYMRVPNTTGMTGMQAATYMLRAAGLQVRLETVSGQLTDHYDPRHKTLRLSAGVARSASVGAVAVAAHEIGHALQDAQAFALLRLRSGLVPMVNFTSWLGPLLFFLGFLLDVPGLATVGVFCFAGAVLFALLTLPVELDASRRALQLLKQSNVLDTDALRGARQVLSAAALTYVAALAQALSTLLYYLFVLNNNSGRRRRR